MPFLFEILIFEFFSIQTQGVLGTTSNLIKFDFKLNIELLCIFQFNSIKVIFQQVVFIVIFHLGSLLFEILSLRTSSILFVLQSFFWLDLPQESPERYRMLWWICCFPPYNNTTQEFKFRFQVALGCGNILLCLLFQVIILILPNLP